MNEKVDERMIQYPEAFLRLLCFLHRLFYFNFLAYKVFEIEHDLQISDGGKQKNKLPLQESMNDIQIRVGSAESSLQARVAVVTSPATAVLLGPVCLTESVHSRSDGAEGEMTRHLPILPAQTSCQHCAAIPQLTNYISGRVDNCTFDQSQSKTPNGVFKKRNNQGIFSLHQ